MLQSSKKQRVVTKNDLFPKPISYLLAVLLIGWVSIETAHGQVVFSDQQIISTNASGAESVFAIDLDGDGDIDVLSAYLNDHKIAWYGQLNPILTVDSDVILLTRDAGQQVIDVKNDGGQTLSWNASVTSGNWITLVNESGADETADLVFSYEENPDSRVRTAKIEIVAEGAENSPLTLTVQQNGSPFLQVEITEKFVGANTGQVIFGIVNASGSTFQWTAEITSGSWISLPKSSGSDTDDLAVVYEKNTSGSLRTAEIELTSSNAEGGPITLTLKQDTEPITISLDPFFVRVEPLEGSLTANIVIGGGGTEALPWQASVISGSSWISLITPEGATEQEPLRIAYQPNPTINSRTAQVKVTSELADGVSDTLTIEQNGIASMAVAVKQKSVDFSEGITSFDITKRRWGYARLECVCNRWRLDQP